MLAFCIIRFSVGYILPDWASWMIWFGFGFRFVTIDSHGFVSPNLLYPCGNRSNEMVLIMTLRDCYAHEQALIHYDPNATVFYTTRFRSDVPPIYVVGAKAAAAVGAVAVAVAAVAAVIA